MAMNMAIWDMTLPKEAPVEAGGGNRATEPAVRRINASKFKAKCLELLDEVAAGRGEIVITRNGKPVSRLVPVEPPRPAPFGCDRGRIRILGDVVSPLDVET